MKAKHPAFRTFRRKVPLDPNPNVLTQAERDYIDERLGSGNVPSAELVRKLVRLSDERQAKLDRVLGECQGLHTASSSVIASIVRGECT